MKNLKKAAAVTMVAGGLLAAGAGMASATEGSHADGKAVGSPGVVSGNLVQVPVGSGRRPCRSASTGEGMCGICARQWCGR